MYVDRNYLDDLINSQKNYSLMKKEVIEEVDEMKSIFEDYCTTFNLDRNKRAYQNKQLKVYFDYFTAPGYGKFIIERKTPFYRKNVVLVDSFFHITEDKTVQINESALGLTPIDENDIERLFIDMKQDMLNKFDTKQSKVDLYRALKEV